MTGSTAETRDVGTGGGEEPKVPLFKAVWNPRMLICVFIGFSSGAPYWYVYSLIPYWLRTNDVSLISIGSLAVLQLPFTWKFLVAPLLDRYAVASFGRRRTWMLGSQITLMLLIAGMGFFNPKQEILGIAYLYFFVVCGAALQDIAIDAYRREILPDNELGLGSAFHVNAWRYASLASFSLPVILSAYIDWRLVHIVAALCMLPGLLLTLTVKEPKIHGSPPKTLRDAVILPFKEFLFERRGGLHKALYVLAFMLLYKFGDALATALITPFYVDMGFGPWEIGLVSKGVSLTSAGVGIFAGGFIMFRIGINKSIWMFGVVQLLSILGLAFLATQGDNIWVLVGAVTFEYLGVGLGTSALVAFQARETNLRFTATQLALFTSLMALPRLLTGVITGVMVDGVPSLGFAGLGWSLFFVFCAVTAIPGLLLLPKVAPWNENEASV